jgi:osmotically-inducible protein OsmY
MTATITQTDEQIQREVQAELEWDARIRSTEIGVAVKDGVVTLTGWVDSYAKKLAAERAAHRVRGVKAVANEIEVRLPSSAERIRVEVQGSKVILRGTVENHITVEP